MICSYRARREARLICRRCSAIVSGRAPEASRWSCGAPARSSSGAVSSGAREAWREAMAGWEEARGSPLSPATSGKLPDVRTKVRAFECVAQVDQEMVAIRDLLGARSATCGCLRIGPSTVATDDLYAPM